jgi:hypothetical protein
MTLASIGISADQCMQVPAVGSAQGEILEGVGETAPNSPASTQIDFQESSNHRDILCRANLHGIC